MALVDSPEHVCCRYRLKAFAPYFERHGHTLEFVSLPKNWWERLAVLRRLGGASVILQRKLLSNWELGWLRRSVRQLIFDFDDAVFLRNSYSAKNPFEGRRLQRFAATIQASDVVVAGNSFLAAEASQRAPATRTCVIPTCVEPARYPVLGAWPFSAPLQLVWVGSSSTLPSLQLCAPQLEAVGETLPGLQLKVICDNFLRIKNVDVLECPWSEAAEAEEIAGGDVGVSWLPDDLWSRGKCGLKVLQYMAAGLPVVANPVGVHLDMIQHGETGFLASTPAEWCASLSRLAGDADLRTRLGQAGRRRVEREYSVAVGAGRWLSLLDELSLRMSRSA